MAKFKSGQSGNPAGRKPGRRNKVSENMKGMLEALLAKEAEKVPALLKELTAKDRLDIFAKLARFVLPVQKSVDLHAKGDTRIVIQSAIPEPKPRPVEFPKLLEEPKGTDVAS